MNDNDFDITNESVEQEFYGPFVRKICGCAVVELEEVVFAIELPVTYSQLVSGIINKKYGADKVQAITANYISIQTSDIPEEKAGEYVAEYMEYQNWREKAKKIAKEAFGIE